MNEPSDPTSSPPSTPPGTTVPFVPRGRRLLLPVLAAAVALPAFAMAAPAAPSFAAQAPTRAVSTATAPHVFVPPVKISPSTVLSVGKRKHGHRRVVLSSKGPSIHKGDVVVAGVGKHTRTGLLVKVTKVQRKAHGRRVLATVPAGLQQALPPGDYADSQDFGQPASGRFKDGGDIGTPAAGSPFSVLPSCKNSQVHASVDGAVNLQGKVEGALHLDWTGIQDARFRLTVDESAWMKFKLDAKASCSASAELVKVPLNLTVSGVVVPVTLIISLDATLTADASVAGGANQHSSMVLGFQYQHGHMTSLSSGPTDKIVPDKLQIQGKATAEIGITASLTAGILDVFSGRINVRGAVGATVNSSADPRWEVYATARAWADLVLWVPIIHTVLWKSGELPMFKLQRSSLARAVKLNVPATLPAGVVGKPYSYQLSASDGFGEKSFQSVQSSLPAGLTVSATGLVSGVPEPIGDSSKTFRPVLTVTDDAMHDSDSASPSLTVTTLAPPTISTGEVQAGEFGTALQVQLNGSSPNGGPLHWKFVDGSNTRGYTLSDDGVLRTGAVGVRDSLSVQVTDAASQTTSARITVKGVIVKDPPGDYCDRMPWKCRITP